MWIEPSGRLVKKQITPREEISEVGEDFVSVRKHVEDQRNLLPIPPEARRMLTALRDVMSGDAEALETRYSPVMTEAQPLWRLRLAVHDDPDYLPIFLIGCGSQLRGIEIREPGGVRRLVVFDRPL
ncbi:hypothetical protein H0I76_16860 [Limibaculum sp. M0105]|uniref:Uncharacterized protein n=1 Tax=Thermohalobaculum xanthum TaxID=2753746 RepID=A0A8J7SG84_9RHOB|nr:hypothetical protein [Thermohalobaculum xanthum]MBK0400873.1 hypothetical protein [Thermohalobaculum xanthum]